jgi:pimeloyl-ACP methyl ester carboxylesterase
MSDTPTPPQPAGQARPPGARKKSYSERLRSFERPPVTHGYFKSFDGTKLFYSIEGQGKPLIFCYGLVCSSLHWTYQIEHFQRTHQAIWFDYRGHQNSELPADLSSLTLGNVARDLGLLLDELGVRDAVFLGHSMGVNVVLELYRQQPHRFAGMVLANGTAKRPLETLFNSNALQGGFALLRKLYDLSPQAVQFAWRLQRNNPFARQLMSLAGFNPHLTPAEDIQLYLNQIADMDPRVLIHMIESYDHCDATAWLHTVKVPTLIIAGEKDLAIPLPQQELLHQLIPGSRLEIIRHGSHCPQMDLPELVNHKIERFLADLEY